MRSSLKSHIKPRDLMSSMTQGTKGPHSALRRGRGWFIRARLSTLSGLSSFSPFFCLDLFTDLCGGALDIATRIARTKMLKYIAAFITFYSQEKQLTGPECEACAPLRFRWNPILWLESVRNAAPRTHTHLSISIYISPKHAHDFFWLSLGF